MDHAPAFAQEWQWSVGVHGGKDHKDTRAWLWIPPSCSKVRAVIVAQNNMEELSILENGRFRQRMGELGFAEVWISPMFDHIFNFAKGAGEAFAGGMGAGEVFNRMMGDLADTSGYTELKYCPVVGVGHSAAASWPYYFAAWDPDRTLACISVSGQWPYVRHPAFSPDIWSPEQNIDYIPSLETMGEYEAADSWSAEGLKERVQHPFMPLSMLACPAEGHFAASQKKIDYIALFIKKAAEYRLPDYDPMKGPPKLRKIDPMRVGWLMDKWRYDQEPVAAPAPVDRYKGDKAAAFWFFDEEMVRATEQYESVYRRMQAPLLGYVQEGKIVAQHNTHLQVHLRFIPGEDGISFFLKGDFLDTVPGESPRPAMWTGLPVGARITHPDGEPGRGRIAHPDGESGADVHGRAIRIDKVIGPFEKINDTLFRLALEKSSEQAPRNYVLTFAAVWPGDGVYKPAVQQAEMVVPGVNEEGIEQHISFPVIPDKYVGGSGAKYIGGNGAKYIGGDGAQVTLTAVSDASLPVYYYVLEGPAVIKGDKLYITPLPSRARLPVKVTVVAWQYGRSVEPKVRTAAVVSRTFFIRK